MEPLSLAEMLRAVSEGNSLAELRTYRDRLHEELLRRLLFDHPLEWNRLINRVHDAMIQRVIQLSEEALSAEGAIAPVPYGFLLFGSGGRAEQTLWSDQDNGLIYDDPDSQEQQDAAEIYFALLAARISSGLEEIGYPPCSGGVICTNAMWRRSLSSFRSLFRSWLEDPHWEHVRYLLIAADLRTVYGHAPLGERLLQDIYEYVADHPSMLEHLLHNTLHHKVSLGVFGQLIKERYGEDAGGVDIKYGAYIPIVNGIRLLSIEAGIYASSTEERLAGLISTSFVEEEIGQDWLEALSIALKLRSVTPYQLVDGHYTTRGKLTSEQLTKERVSSLKLCLRIGSDLQKYVKKSVHKEIEKG